MNPSLGSWCWSRFPVAVINVPAIREQAGPIAVTVAGIAAGLPMPRSRTCRS
ncbi:MAG: hypothetical protein WAY93_06530 [Atopobiaceae bacterium]